MQYPIICVLGRRGSGKTLLMTAIAHDESKAGTKIFANYRLFGIPCTNITWEMLLDMPDWLHDGIILLDEIQMGADAYEIFKKGNKAITKLATQIRKRKLTMYYATQVFTMATKRLRQQTNYIIEVTATTVQGLSHVRVYDHMQEITGEIIREFDFDGRLYYNMYDTNEIIEGIEENDPNE